MPRRLDLLLGLLLVGLTLAAYAHVGRNDFVNFDDELYVTGNPMVRDGLNAASVAWAWTTFHASNWHPLTWMSLQLDAHLFGLEPAAFHWTNLLWHTANVLLLYAALRRMTDAVWRSALVAALFAVHPLHVESVAWVAERKDVLSTFFWLLTLLLYTAYARRPGPGRYLALTTAFALGLLAKPMLVTLPCVLLLLDYWPLGRLRVADWGLRIDLRSATRNPQSAILEKLPLFVLAGLSGWMTLLAQRQGGAVLALEIVPFPPRLGNALIAYVRYLWLTFCPSGLAVYYPHPLQNVSLWQAAGAALLLAALTALFVGRGRRWPYLAVGWLWFLGTLVPVIGLVQVGDQAMADRYTYVPHIGLFILVVWGAADLLAAGYCPIGLRAVLAGGVLLACAILTRVQVTHWRNSVTLWRHTVGVTPPSYRGSANLGSALYDQGKFREATPHLRDALRRDDRDPELHLLLGEALLRQRKVDEAIEPFRAALRIKPGHAEAHYNLGRCLLAQDNVAEAHRHLAQALHFRPDHADAHSTLGWVHLRQGETEEAAQCFASALWANPRHGRALQGQGLIYLRGGKVAEAVERFARAVAIDPHSAEAHDHLAQGLAAQGKWPEALAHLEQALDRARAEGRPDLARQIEERLLLYQNHPSFPDGTETKPE